MVDKTNKFLRYGNSKTHYFTDEQVKKIIETETFLNKKTAFIIANDTGARAGEMTELHIKDFDFERNQVIMWDSKRKAKKIIPLKEETISAVILYQKTSEIKGKLFNFHPTTLNNWIKEACERCSIKSDSSKNIRWHSWRGTFVRNNKDKGDMWLMQVTGDSYHTLLKYYQELTEEDLRRIKNGKRI